MCDVVDYEIELLLRGGCLLKCIALRYDQLMFRKVTRVQSSVFVAVLVSDHR